MDLSEKERLILYNQYRILEKLYPDEEKDCQLAQKILLEGYELEYDELITMMGDVSREVCKETIDILQMFRSLFFSYEKLEDKSGIDEYDVKFQGFDGNEEGEYYSYAEFFILDKKRYEEFNKCEINSHCNKLPQYREMLSVWRQFKRFTSDLTKEQILDIISSK